MSNCACRVETVERFGKFVRIPKDETQCWPWSGGKNSKGYGYFWDGKRLVRAHRFMWEFSDNSKLKLGQLVIHSCDNRGCVNPAHLRVGTASDNMQDMVKRGRHYMHHRMVGPNGRTLVVSDVKAIRHLLTTTKMLHREIAEWFGVHRSTISELSRGEIWKIVPVDAS